MLHRLGRSAIVTRGNLADRSQKVADHLDDVFGFLDEEHDRVVNADDGFDNARAGNEDADDPLNCLLDNLLRDELFDGLNERVLDVSRHLLQLFPRRERTFGDQRLHERETLFETNDDGFSHH